MQPKRHGRQAARQAMPSAAQVFGRRHFAQRGPRHCPPGPPARGSTDGSSSNQTLPLPAPWDVPAAPELDTKDKIDMSLEDLIRVDQHGNMARNIAAAPPTLPIYQGHYRGSSTRTMKTNAGTTSSGSGRQQQRVSAPWRAAKET